MQYDIGAIQQRVQSSIWSNRHIGNYEIVRKIGEGSFSSVFLAVHTITRHEVVLKSADKMQANIASEIANMSLLSHPHIVRLYEYIIMPDKVWLVLEYCGGQELYNYLTASKTIPPHLACRLFAQLAGAVAYAHQLHCAHRDLKLENVLLDNDGNIKLGDFGFTRSYVPRTMLETVCGTESYMAPELVLRQKYNPEAADVWSLGVILYAMLYGRLPFDEDNSVETLQRIVESDPAFPHIVKAEYLVDVAKKMLCKNPNQRPKIGQILNELKEPGKQQKQLLTQITNHPESSYIFSSKEERTVLKGMKALSIDLHSVAASIMHHKCDALHGLWFTALDRQRSLSKQLLDSATASNTTSVHRKKSKASIKSSKSTRLIKGTTVNNASVSAIGGSANGGFISHTNNAPSLNGGPVIYGAQGSNTPGSLSNYTTPVKDSHLVDTSMPTEDESDDDLKQDTAESHWQDQRSLTSLTRRDSLDRAIGSSGLPSSKIFMNGNSGSFQQSPRTTSQTIPDVAPLPSEELPYNTHHRKDNGASKSSSSLTEFIERRSTGRSRRAMEKIISVLKIKRNNTKENLLAYYNSVRENDKHFSKSASASATANEPSTDRIIDSRPIGITISEVANKRDGSNINPPQNGIDKQLNTPVLDLGKGLFPQPSSRRHSTLSLTSSLSIPLDTPVRRSSTTSRSAMNSDGPGTVHSGSSTSLSLAAPTATQQQNAQQSRQQQPMLPAQLQHIQRAPSPQESSSSPNLPAKPISSQGSQSSQISTNLLSSSVPNISRPMSTYSQISQISQLSQSSVDASMLLSEIQESKNTSSLFMPNGIRRSNSVTAKKFTGMVLSNGISNLSEASGAGGNSATSANSKILPGSSSTPPGTPNLPRSRARFMTIKQKIPQKIDEGDE